MRRVGRIMLNGTTILSLLLALAVAASWGLSYVRGDRVVYSFPSYRRWVAVGSSRGRAIFSMWQVERASSGRTVQARWKHYSATPVDLPTGEHAFMGISWSHLSYANYFEFGNDDIVIPHAYLLLLFAALPSIRIYPSLRRRRRLMLPGHCRTCGYDLRATPDRCPECGTIPAKT